MTKATTTISASMKQKNNNEMSLIEKFFSYELNETELDRFDQLYNKDEAFQKKVESYRIAKGYVEEKYFPERQALLQEKRKELERLNPTAKSSSKLMLKRILMAASVLLFLGVAIWLFNKPTTTPLTLEKQALEIAQNTTNFDLYEITVRSNQTAEENQLWEAVQAQNWSQVISLTNSLANDDPALTIAAMAHYYQGNYERALALFNNSKLQNSGIEDNLLWWQAATHLQLKQNDQAKQVLREIINKKFPSTKQAQTLLQQIENAE